MEKQAPEKPEPGFQFNPKLSDRKEQQHESHGAQAPQARNNQEAGGDSAGIQKARDECCQEKKRVSQE